MGPRGRLAAAASRRQRCGGKARGGGAQQRRRPVLCRSPPAAPRPPPGSAEWSCSLTRDPRAVLPGREGEKRERPPELGSPCLPGRLPRCSAQGARSGKAETGGAAAPRFPRPSRSFAEATASVRHPRCGHHAPRGPSCVPRTRPGQSPWSSHLGISSRHTSVAPSDAVHHHLGN